MVRLQDVPEQYRQQYQHEQRHRREHVNAVIAAIRSGNAEQFHELILPYDNHPDFWTPLVRRIARDIHEVTQEIRQAFCDAWLQTKMLGLKVDDHRSLCQALRILTQKYIGPELRLFRGASASERRRGVYGVSWTSSLSTAQEFADGYRVWPGGSVVLETTAPPAAIITAIEYPPPITETEKLELGLPPTTNVVEWHDECEYLVDRRQLDHVKVLRRYSQQHIKRSHLDAFHDPPSKC